MNQFQLKVSSLKIPTLVSKQVVAWVGWIRAHCSFRHYFSLSLFISVFAFVWITLAEMRGSYFQARLFSRIASEMNFAVVEGKNPAAHFPQYGPYDERLGYRRLPDLIQKLEANAFVIERQAVLSHRQRQFVERGGFAIFNEKTQAGLQILDAKGHTIFERKSPERVYDNIAAIPPLVVQTLLFIENRELLEEAYPKRNPAIEWDRFVLAVAGRVERLFRPDVNGIGGSTLATQLEKFRHSEGGRTNGLIDKLHQMVSASLRAYHEGPETIDSQRRIVVDYLNSTPFAAHPDVGEVFGLGDGLWFWFGVNFETFNELLSTPALPTSKFHARSLAYKQVLALLLAQRRPSYYLVQNRAALETLANSYLRIMTEAGIIDQPTRDAALAQPLKFGEDQVFSASLSNRISKTATTQRSALLSLLGVPIVYELDRLDLTVTSTLDSVLQAQVKDTLKSFANGKRGKELVRGDPSKLVYSFTLLERKRDGNYLRVQTDTLDIPLNANDDTKLDLGSTAKLRTLLTYLDVVTRIYHAYTGLPAEELLSMAQKAQDPISAWSLRTMGTSPNITLGNLLEMAMQRLYSASPAEAFFTGGGVHRFVNFNSADNRRRLTVAEALRNSVNLVFIRVMRDIVEFYIAENVGSKNELLKDVNHPERAAYLARFIERESNQHLRRLFKQYGHLSEDDILAFMTASVRSLPLSLGVLFRLIRPEADINAFGSFIREHLNNDRTIEQSLEDLFETSDPRNWLLSDLGYITRIPPLDLWFAAYLNEHPGASLQDILSASAEVQLEAYAWLFKTKWKQAQDMRIRIVLEQDAFIHIHKAWRKLGYPFESLVPSYATAIGSSADRPSALAELMGIVTNGGLRLPTVEFDTLRFATDTPYETILTFSPPPPERVVSPQVAEIVKQALIDAVENGTGRRIAGGFTLLDGTRVAVGGKTGTGDHRYKRVNASGHVLQSRVVSRSATFVFFVGDRFFGTVTVYVMGEAAGNYKFTSSLPVAILKSMEPVLEPVLSGNDGLKVIADKNVDSKPTRQNSNPMPILVIPTASASP